MAGRSVDNSDPSDPEVEVVAVYDFLSDAEKRCKLVDFLLCSPPPKPFCWPTFQEYIVGKFGSFYPQNVIKDVFNVIWRTLAKHECVAEVIDLNSVDEGVDGTLEDPESTIPLPPDDLTFSEEVAFKKIAGDIHGFLQEINDSTSCSICSKLKYRLRKLQDIVKSKMSGPDDTSVQSEQRANNEGEQQPRRSYEKVTENILLVEVMELSFADITKIQSSLPNIEQAKPQETGKETSEPDSSGSPKATQKVNQCNGSPGIACSSNGNSAHESVPDSTSNAKKASKRRNSAHEILCDSTEVGTSTPPAKKNMKE